MEIVAASRNRSGKMLPGWAGSVRLGVPGAKSLPQNLFGIVRDSGLGARFGRLGSVQNRFSRLNGLGGTFHGFGDWFGMFSGWVGAGSVAATAAEGGWHGRWNRLTCRWWFSRAGLPKLSQELHSPWFFGDLNDEMASSESCSAGKLTEGRG